MPGRTRHPGAACGDGGDFGSVHQQADKQERRHREQGVRGDARKSGLRYPNHICEEGTVMEARTLMNNEIKLENMTLVTVQHKKTSLKTPPSAENNSKKLQEFNNSKRFLYKY